MPQALTTDVQIKFTPIINPLLKLPTNEQIREILLTGLKAAGFPAPASITFPE